MLKILTLIHRAKSGKRCKFVGHYQAFIYMETVVKYTPKNKIR